MLWSARTSMFGGNDILLIIAAVSVKEPNNRRVTSAMLPASWFQTFFLMRSGPFPRPAATERRPRQLYTRP